MARRPLRQTLPAAISALAAAVVVLSVLFASRQVGESARVAAEERLTRVVSQLADMAAGSAENRRQLKLRVGGDPVVAAALRGEAVAQDALLGVLEQLRTPADSGLPIQLRNRGAAIIFADMPDVRATEVSYDPLIPFDSTPAYGAFHQYRGEMLYYSTTPVVADGVVHGWVVQLRRIGSPRIAEDMGRLIGPDSRVLFSYDTDSLWVSLSGEPVTAPVRLPPFDTTVLMPGDDGPASLMRAQRVAGTPWNVVVAIPHARITAGSRLFMMRMTMFGIVLVIGAAVVAWLLSRRLTAPLTALASASDAVAAGDYSQRVPVEGSEELSRLAAAFNAMSAQVAVSHEALRQRLNDAQRMSRELEIANVKAEEARAAAQAADRAKSEFLATMSHEIRTPINAVLGFCELLELENLSDENRHDYLGRTRRAARQLAALVEDVLDLAKVDSGRMRIEARNGAVRDVVDQVLALIEEPVRRKRISVEVDVPADVMFFADAQRVEQILLNLLSNAVKFTPAGGRIRVAAEAVNGSAAEEWSGVAREKRRVRIQVVDSGIGIDPVEHERIFEPFIQAQAGYTREYGGTGLGLTISRRLARLMNGEIFVESTPGLGSTFTVLLPEGAGAHAL